MFFNFVNSKENEPVNSLTLGLSNFKLCKRYNRLNKLLLFAKQNKLSLSQSVEFICWCVSVSFANI